MNIAAAETERERAVVRAAVAERDAVALADLAEASCTADARRVLLHRDLADRRRVAAAEAYRAALPEVAISRCPITAAEVRVAIDTAGIDGPWWRATHPVRRPWPDHDTLFAITGALQLSSPIERTEFLVKPGPGVPYVLPLLLEEPRAVAVISTVAIGAHTGYAICYFAPVGARRRPTNDWGTDEYTIWLADGRRAWGSEPDEQRDFELAPWIERGRVRWIAPPDPSLEPRSGAARCPYLAIAGTREPQRVQYGRTW